MKFTNGFWLLKKEITPIYAVEYAGHKIVDDKVVIYASSKHIRDRGDCLNIGLLTITLSSPIENVIYVQMAHFMGSAQEQIKVDVNTTSPKISIAESEEELIFTSGTLSARVCKKPNAWGIRYYDGEKYLTSTGYRNMACMQNTQTGLSYMVEQLGIDIGEYIYGLGERFTPFVKNGQSVEIWNEDGGTASEQTYKNIPFYITGKGYGILVDSHRDLDFEIASEKVENVQFSTLGEELSYYVISGGSPKGTLTKYCELTGKPALPPAWSFGLWLTTSFTTNYDEETTSGFIQGMKDHGIPLHVFHFDCYWMRAYCWCDFIWDPNTFPDPKSMLQRYHDKGLKICVWINSYIAQQSYLFDEGKKKGFLVKKSDGSVWQTDLWQPGMALVDFTNPDAVSWYQSKLEELLDMGVDCFKTDFGERVPVKDIVWADGSDPHGMHNRYTYLYNKAVFELLERKRGKKEACLFARSATVGSQQFPAHWGGDCSATYSSMAETLRGGLSLACGGFGFWSHDISGFEQTASPDIYKRWCQFGLLSSHSRLHGSSSYRVPWLFDEEACVVLKEMVELKCRLMPYLYQQAVIAHETGVPMLRPMFMEYPEDPSCKPLDLQYMFGESLLVAPIFSESGTVQYYVPKGTWINLFTNKIVEGNEWKKETYDYHSMPLLVAPNSLLALGKNESRPDYDFAEGVTIAVSVFDDGAEKEIQIPNLQGETVLRVKAKREGDRITVKSDRVGNWNCSYLAGNATIEKLDDTTYICMCNNSNKKEA